MTPTQISLVQSSFAQVAPIADQAALIFYDDLFARAPQLRTLFPDDMSEQRVKLMKMLGTAVNGLDDWASVAPAVADLGRRHQGYGVERRDYAPVGESLIATLEAGLGAAFTPQVREAWLACYAVVAETMLTPAGVSR